MSTVLCLVPGELCKPPALPPRLLDKLSSWVAAERQLLARAELDWQLHDAAGAERTLLGGSEAGAEAEAEARRLRGVVVRHKERLVRLRGWYEWYAGAGEALPLAEAA